MEKIKKISDFIQEYSTPYIKPIHIDTDCSYYLKDKLNSLYGRPRLEHHTIDEIQKSIRLQSKLYMIESLIVEYNKEHDTQLLIMTRHNKGRKD